MSGAPDSGADQFGKDNPPPDLELLSELLKTIPEEHQDQLVQSIRTIILYSQASGPLSSADEFSKFSPEVQRVILIEAIENRKHRTTFEDRGQKFAFVKEMAGLVFGFVLACNLIDGSVQSVLAGRSVAGLMQIGGAVSLIVGAFYYTGKQKHNDSRDR